MVPLAGLVPLAETPRSDVINVVLCQQETQYLIAVRQSVLLSQNGSHPQVRPGYGYQYKTPNLTEDRGFVVPLAGLEPARMLLRGILRYLRINFQENFTNEEKCKNGAILHEKPSKTPQNKQFLQKIVHAPISLKNSQVPRSSQIFSKKKIKKQNKIYLFLTFTRDEF